MVNEGSDKKKGKPKMATHKPKLKKKARWKKQYKQPLHKWHIHQGNTNDCGPFSATIAANALRDALVLDAPTLARAMERAPEDKRRIIPARIKGWATFPWGVVYALRKMGFKARWRMGASLNRLQRNLDRGRVSIVIVGDPLNFKDGVWRGWAHYKVLYAWDPDEGWAFVDPAAREEEVFSYQEPDEFAEQWTWMGRHLIEVWDDDDEDDEGDEDDEF